MWYDNDICPVDAGDRDILHNSDWVFGVQCKSHSCSNAVKWGFTSEVADSAVEDAHIVVQSLLNSSMLLHSKMDAFLPQYLDFERQRVTRKA